MVINSLFEYAQSYTFGGWHFENQKLGFAKIYYILNGTAHYIDDKNNMIFKKNHLYVLPANVTHTLYDEPGDQLNHLYIHFYTFPAIEKLIERNPENDDFLKDMISLLQKYATQKDKYREIKYLSQAVLDHIFENDTDNDSLSFQIKSFIDNNLQKHLEMEDLSKIFCYSPSQIVKVFKTNYSMTPMQYYKIKKFEKIAQYLQSGSSCEEITQLFEFSTPANLSRDFKNIFGVSPQKYINQSITKKKRKT